MCYLYRPISILLTISKSFLETLKSIILKSVAHTSKNSPESNMYCIYSSEMFGTYRSVPRPGRAPENLYKAIIANKKSTLLEFFCDISTQNVKVAGPVS